MKRTINLWRFVLLLFLTMMSLDLLAQVTVSGVVTDQDGNTLPGVNVFEKGTTNGTISDMDGKYRLSVPSGATVTFTYIGCAEQEFKVTGTRTLNVVLKEDTQEIEEVVVVGYGQQKKASVVGAITQTSGETLQRAAGVTNVGAALTGNLPGVVTEQSTGIPGGEDPKITIRGASSWNSSDPLVLVDGIEREMSSVDISSVESISVLKDASATAVYGVRGANGVILITTKRGAEGKAKIDVGFTTTVKAPSKLPNKLDSYDALIARNQTIEMELPVTPEDSWAYITPMAEIAKYRNTDPEARDDKGNFISERYPNVDWQDVLFRDYAMSYSANLSISGGSKVVRYYAAADYANEGDLMNVFDNGRGYKTGYDYNRLNARSNLDFNITKTTVLKVNIAGSLAISKRPRMNQGDAWQEAQRWAGAYNIAPDVFLPQYSNGGWGYYPQVSNVSNSAENAATSGMAKNTTNTITTDFNLDQDLSFLTKGLKLSGSISWDNRFEENGRGIADDFTDDHRMWIDPKTGEVYNNKTVDSNTGFDWVEDIRWSPQGGGANNGNTFRRLSYKGQINYMRKFGDHEIGGMGVFKREESATGSELTRYREEWAFRATYNYKNRYSIEYNGCYNGSEKFSPEYRFAFFNSGGINWTLSEEEFMQSIKDRGWIEILKFRASYGEVGDDNVRTRWLYLTQWSRGGKVLMTSVGESTFNTYDESVIGNYDVHWEKSRKFNFGIDYSFLKGLLAGSVDIFRDRRSDILISGGDRAIPAYYGGSAPTINKGKTKNRGYEVELRVNKELKSKGMRFWGNFNFTHSENKIIEKDDQALRPNYQKQEGYVIGQEHSFISDGYLQNIDQVYGSPKFESDDRFRLSGNYYIVDFNGDGQIDSKDSAPYGYSGTPQNTYSTTIGYEWKGFSCFVQFYGVTNVTRDVTLQSFGNKLNTVYDLGSVWSVDNPNADMTYYHWSTAPVSKSGGSFPAYGSQYKFDGSYIRLKNIELAYSWTSKSWIKKMGFTYLKVFVNGNNLWLWTRMPDDRESNLGDFGGYMGAYPTVKRYNIGVKFSL